MAKSQNGYPVRSGSETHKWIIPGTNRHLVLSRGPAGFVLVWFASWYHDKIARLDLGTWDEWGWAVRPVRGGSVYSNHASGTAIDLNATRHPLGTDPSETLTRWQIRKIRRRLVILMRVIRWGGDYNGRKDTMHYEIDKGPKAVRRLARVLRATRRGRRILKANPR